MRSSSKAFVSSKAKRFGSPRQSGLTLIELMVTMAVLAILAVIALPSMTILINGNRLSGMNDELTASVQLARSEAIRLNQRVTLCGSTDGTTCAADWSRWIVVANGSGQVIRDNEAIGPVQVSGPGAGIEFRPSGLVDNQQQLMACVPTTSPNENQRIITVMVSGAIRTDRNDGGGSCP